MPKPRGQYQSVHGLGPEAMGRLHYLAAFVVAAASFSAFGLSLHNYLKSTPTPAAVDNTELVASIAGLVNITSTTQADLSTLESMLTTADSDLGSDLADAIDSLTDALSLPSVVSAPGDRTTNWTWPENDGTANQLLATNGSGYLTFVSAPVVPPMGSSVYDRPWYIGYESNGGIINGSVTVSVLTTQVITIVTVEGIRIPSTVGPGSNAILSIRNIPFHRLDFYPATGSDLMGLDFGGRAIQAVTAYFDSDADAYHSVPVVAHLGNRAGNDNAMDIVMYRADHGLFNVSLGGQSRFIATTSFIWPTGF